jgi:hypothetical protein
VRDIKRGPSEALLTFRHSTADLAQALGAPALGPVEAPHPAPKQTAATTANPRSIMLTTDETPALRA